MTANVHLEFSAEDGIHVVRASGEIDASNSDDVRRSITESITNQAIDVAVDLTDVSYVDSAGIRVLFDLARRLDRRRQRLLLVIPRASHVRRSLQVGGLLGAVTVVEALPEASGDEPGG